TATANQIIEVTAVNDAPVAVDDSYSVAEEGTVTLTPLDLDSDLDGDILTIVSINGIPLTPGTAQTINVLNGTVSVSDTGVITFTGDTDFNGTVIFPYVITDGTDTATADQIIEVTPVNDAPVAVDDNYTVSEESTVILTPLDLDSDIDGDILSIVSINGTLLTPGTEQVITTPNGTVNIDAAGVITFTPSDNYNGTETFAYVITDGTATATANQIIEVTGVNDVPVAVDDSYSVAEEGTVTLTPLDLDSD
ncbi:tandem-95 repeat protein, partial [Bizionia saleffrena]